MRWPDRDNSLVLAALTVRDAADPHGRPARMCTHASIAPVDGWSTTSAADAELVRGERNAFAMPTTALREIVDDLVAAGAHDHRDDAPDARSRSRRG